VSIAVKQDYITTEIKLWNSLIETNTGALKHQAADVSNCCHKKLQQHTFLNFFYLKTDGVLPVKSQ